MKIRYIGDVHGHYGTYKRRIRDVPRSVQVGDMGVGFFQYDRDGEIVPVTNPPFDSMSAGDHTFIRGNHDNPNVCRRHKFWIPDMTVRDGIFHMGGALSIDRAYRTEGMSWWEDEELSYQDLQTAIDVYATVKPEVVVTHECPDFIASEYLARVNRQKLQDGSRTRQALDQMWGTHQPRLWIFGHWHHTYTMRAGRTTFQCLGELDYCDVDIKDDGDIEVTMSDGSVYEA